MSKYEITLKRAKGGVFEGIATLASAKISSVRFKVFGHVIHIRGRSNCTYIWNSLNIVTEYLNWCISNGNRLSITVQYIFFYFNKVRNWFYFLHTKRVEMGKTTKQFRIIKKKFSKFYVNSSNWSRI